MGADPIRSEPRVTLGLGVRSPTGQAVPLDPVDPVQAFADAIDAHHGLEAWWAGSTFVEDRRHGSAWLAGTVVAVDVDTPDHGPLTAAQVDALDELAAAGSMPGNVFHRSPAGCRVAAVLEEPTTDRAAFERATRGLMRQVADVLAPHELGLEVDRATGDVARMFFAPNATAKGTERRAAVVVLRREPIPLDELTAAVPAEVEPVLEQPAAPVEPLSDLEVERILAALAHIDPDDRETWLRVGMSLRWTGDARARAWWDDWSRRSSKFDEREQSKAWHSIVPSREGRATVTLGTLFAIARDGGYRGASVNVRHPVPEPSPDDDPDVERDVLSLDDARARTLDVLAEASQRRRSLDLAGSPGLGKSHAAITAEIDRLIATDREDGPHPVAIFAIAGATELAVERAAMVRQLVEEHGAADEIAVELALGRQDIADDELDRAPFRFGDRGLGFRCPERASASARMRRGFGGCVGCSSRETCANTPGAYLHDWAAIRATMRSRPTILVCTEGALRTFWSRGGRHGRDVRVTLDDTDAIHGGALAATSFARDVVDAAHVTARAGTELVREAGRRAGVPGLEAVLDEHAQRQALDDATAKVASPELVARVGAIALRRTTAPHRLGDLLRRLARIEPLHRHAVEFALGSGSAYLIAEDRGARWSGLGVCAAFWTLLRAYLVDGSLPTMTSSPDGGLVILHGDAQLVGMVRAGRVTRLGAAPLPRTIRRGLGFADAVELVVPIAMRCVAVRQPTGGSWGNRAEIGAAPSVADRLALAIAEDAHAANPDRMLAIGGLGDERGAAGRWPTAVVGRDAAATNRWSGELDALFVRRHAPPPPEIAATVAATLAAIGHERPEIGGPAGQTPSGALLPTDRAVREAWLAGRASTLRNALGRARAVQRPGEIVAVLADRDAERWPWLLPGYSVEAVDLAELGDRLGIPTPQVGAALAALRAAHDADPERTAERVAAIAAAVDGGALSVREIADATGLPRSAVHRLRTAADAIVPESPTRDSCREPRDDHVRAVATMAPEAVVAVAVELSVDPRTVRRARERARTALETPDVQLDPRTIRALERVAAALEAVEDRAAQLVEAAAAVVEPVRLRIRSPSIDDLHDVDSTLVAFSAAEARACALELRRVCGRAVPTIRAG